MHHLALDVNIIKRPTYLLHNGLDERGMEGIV
jgi:hypothetical protein